MILADVLRQQLLENGISELFTIPGDFILPWLSALEAADVTSNEALRLVQLSHEPAAVYAADAAARCRNAPAAVMLTYGAGALNAVNAVAQAYMEYVPLLVFAGYPSAREIDSGLLLHHQLGDVDAQRRIFSEISCAQCRLDDVLSAPAALANCIATAKRERRPVLIELPRDMAQAVVTEPVPEPQSAAASPHVATTLGEAEVDVLATSTLGEAEVDVLATSLGEAEVDVLATTLGEAEVDVLATSEMAVLETSDFAALAAVLAPVRQPLLLVGVKTKRFAFADAVCKLAAQHPLPVLTTLLGRSALEQNQESDQLQTQAASYWSAGVFSGSKADPVLPLLQQADLLICCGVIRSDSNFAAHRELLTQKSTLWVDASETLLPDGRRILAPAAVVLAAVAQLLPTPLSWPASLREKQAASAVPFTATDAAAAQEWGSDLLVQTLHGCLSRQSQQYPFVVDIGDCLFATLAATPDIFIAPAFYASMGFAVPAALGVQLSTGKRPIVLVGDGAFQMTGLELGHCARYRLNPIVIVLNNQSWGMIKAFAPDLAATGLAGWQYAALGRGMGGGAAQVWNAYQFANALDDALADTSRFRLIEVMLPAHSYSRRLADFSAALCGATTACL